MSTPNKVFEGHLQQAEEWRQIPGWEGYYQASSLGRIRNYRTQLVLSPAREKDYDHVRLGRTVKDVPTRRVHILVALAFLGPKPGPGWEVNHKNADSRDNRVENLEYVTKRGNESHAVDLKLKRWKSNRGHLTIDAVRVIRRRDQSARVLADRFKVSQAAIYLVRQGRTWKGVV
jgi:hypothetical protein